MKKTKIFFGLISLLFYFQNSNAQTTEVGIASFYSDKLEGNPTASGEIFSNYYLTAAHRTLPFNTKIKVTNLKNNSEVIVTVNDRGPFVKGRILDLSKGAAAILGFISEGFANIKLEVLPSSYLE